MDTVALVAELVPIAESLITLISKIKAQTPDAWPETSAAFAAAEKAWAEARAKLPPAESVSATPAPPPAESLTTATPETVPEPIAPVGGLSSAQQIAAGLPPAHYVM